MIGLDRPQLLHELVVLGVVDFWIVEHVVAVIVVVKSLAELFDARVQLRQVLDVGHSECVANATAHARPPVPYRRLPFARGQRHRSLGSSPCRPPATAPPAQLPPSRWPLLAVARPAQPASLPWAAARRGEDRKSTRLNSSHGSI